MQSTQPALQGGAPVCRILFRMAGLGCLGCKPHTAPANILSMRVNERKFERTGAEVNTEEEAHTELIPYARAACLKKRVPKRDTNKKGARQAGAP